MSAHNCYQPWEAQIVERTQETPDVFTWRLRLTDPAAASQLIDAGMTAGTPEQLASELVQRSLA